MRSLYNENIKLWKNYIKRILYEVLGTISKKWKYDKKITWWEDEMIKKLNKEGIKW